MVFKNDVAFFFLVFLNIVTRISSINQNWLNPERLDNQLYSTDIVRMVTIYPNGNWQDRGKTLELSYFDCSFTDDISLLICPKVEIFEPCSLYSQWGTRVTSCNDLGLDESIFVVPDNRLFVLPFKEFGENKSINHLHTSSDKPMNLEVVSDSPRIFRLKNFLSDYEGRLLLSNLNQFSDYPKYESLITKTFNNTHYYNNDFDFVLTLQKRVFDLLGIFPYDDSYTEGLIIESNMAGYAEGSHLDWIDPAFDKSYDYSSQNKGSNVFATLVIVLKEAVGGEIVFPLLERKAKSKVREPLIQSELWDSKLNNECKTRFSLSTKKYETYIFYSQKPNGKPDYLSIHGHCPVQAGEQILAKMTIWNAPRPNTWQLNEKTQLFERPKIKPISATFESRDVIGAYLYWEDQVWDELIPGQPMKINTFVGHTWKIRVDNEVVKEWKIIQDRPNQRFVITSEDLPIYILNPIYLRMN